MSKQRLISRVALAAAMIAPGMALASGDVTDIQTRIDKGWELVWQDEFEGKDVDESKWSWERNCWGGGNNELQCYTDRVKNSFIEDGKLVIRAYKETFRGLADVEESGTKEKRTLPYTSARMRTLNKGDFKFGRIEVRAKLPAGQGIWPAIWMLPSDWKYGTWAGSGEIDIVEMVSQPKEKKNKEVHGTLHYGRAWPGNVFTGETYVFEDSDPTEDFHTYAIEWADGEIRWYVDDYHYASQYASGWYTQIKNDEGLWENVEGNAPFNERFHLMLNVAVGGNWPGEPDETTQFPVQMEVDYVRVYKCSKAEASLRGCALKNRRAKRNFGMQPPEIINVVYDPEFINADVVDVYNGETVPPFATGTYISNGAMDVSEVDDPERGKVAQFKFNTNQGVAYWQSALGFDFSQFKSFQFDVQRVADPRKSGGLMMKMDSFYPSGTGDVPLEMAPIGEWKTYKFDLSDLTRHPGSSLNLQNVNTPLVIFPDWDNQEGVVLRVDNVKFER